MNSFLQMVVTKIQFMFLSRNKKPFNSLLLTDD